LFGKSISVVYGEIESRVKDALLVDDRVISVSGFEFRKEGSSAKVKFTVNSIYGGFESEVSVVV